MNNEQEKAYHTQNFKFFGWRRCTLKCVMADALTMPGKHQLLNLSMVEVITKLNLFFCQFLKRHIPLTMLEICKDLLKNRRNQNFACQGTEWRPATIGCSWLSWTLPAAQISLEPSRRGLMSILMFKLRSRWLILIFSISEQPPVLLKNLVFRSRYSYSSWRPDGKTQNKQSQSLI